MTKANKEIKHIDIEKIISESNTGLLNKLPGFVIKWISRIIKQDEMNLILNKYSNDIGLDFLNNIIKEFTYRAKIINIAFGRKPNNW